MVGIIESIVIGLSVSCLLNLASDHPLFGGHLASAALVYLQLSDKSDNLTSRLHSLCVTGPDCVQEQ